MIEELNDEIERVYKVSTPELKDEDKELIWKVHKFFGH